MMVMVPLTGSTEAVLNSITTGCSVFFQAFLSISLIVNNTFVIRFPICGKYVLEFPFGVIVLVKTAEMSEFHNMFVRTLTFR